MLCVLPPVNGVATVELVAINAAMAGVEPAAFGVVLAALEALSEPEWNAFGLTTTTSSVFPMLIVNGPSRDDLGIDYRAGCMGGAAGRGSMTIGRAVALCLRNIGGQRAGETTKSVFGQPARFGFCIGEWEERSPWPSLAQRRGFAADEDVVTVHGGKGTFPMADIHNDDPRDLLYLIAKSMAYPLANMFLGNVENGEVVVAFNPMWAERFGAAFPDIDDLAAFLRENVWQPIDLWPDAERGSCCATGAASTPRVECISSSGPTRSCRSCAAASAACTRSRCRASARARCRASPWCGGHDDGPRRRAAAVDELAGFLRADGADLLVREADPKTARIHLALDARRCHVRRLRAPARRASRHASPTRCSAGSRASSSSCSTIPAAGMTERPTGRRRRRVIPATARQLERARRRLPGGAPRRRRRARGVRGHGLGGVLDPRVSRARRPAAPHGDERPATTLMHPRYSQPGFSRLVQRMEADGLVERRPDPDDRRATTVVLTRAGLAQFRNADAVYVDTLRTSFGRHLAPDEHRRLTSILTRLSSTLSIATEVDR